MATPDPSYRFTSVSNCTVLRQDYLTAKDITVAINEDLHPSAMVRVVHTPGAGAGTASLVVRKSGVNSSPKTVKPTHPFYEPVSNFFGTVSQVALPFTKVGQSP